MRNRGGDASQARPEMPSRGLSSGGLFDPRVDFAAQHPEIDRFGEIRAAIAPSCDAQDARWQWSGHRTGGGGEIANINHLPHFAATFGSDLAGLYHHQATQLILGGAQLLPQEPDEFAAARRRNQAPDLECVHCIIDNFANRGHVSVPDPGSFLKRTAIDAKVLQDRSGFLSEI
jgi:hypothetical protein